MTDEQLSCNLGQCYRCRRSGVRTPDRSNRTQCRQWLATNATFLRSYGRLCCLTCSGAKQRRWVAPLVAFFGVITRIIKIWLLLSLVQISKQPNLCNLAFALSSKSWRTNILRKGFENESHAGSLCKENVN